MGTSEDQIAFERALAELTKNINLRDASNRNRTGGVWQALTSIPGLERAAYFDSAMAPYADAGWNKLGAAYGDETGRQIRDFVRDFNGTTEDVAAAIQRLNRIEKRETPMRQYAAMRLREKAALNDLAASIEGPKEDDPIGQKFHTALRAINELAKMEKEYGIDLAKQRFNAVETVLAGEQIDQPRLQAAYDFVRELARNNMPLSGGALDVVQQLTGNHPKAVELMRQVTAAERSIQKAITPSVALNQDDLDFAKSLKDVTNSLDGQMLSALRDALMDSVLSDPNAAMANFHMAVAAAKAFKTLGQVKGAISLGKGSISLLAAKQIKEALKIPVVGDGIVSGASLATGIPTDIVDVLLAGGQYSSGVLGVALAEAYVEALNRQPKRIADNLLDKNYAGLLGIRAFAGPESLPNAYGLDPEVQRYLDARVNVTSLRMQAENPEEPTKELQQAKAELKAAEQEVFKHDYAFVRMAREEFNWTEDDVAAYYGQRKGDRIRTGEELSSEFGDMGLMDVNDRMRVPDGVKPADNLLAHARFQHKDILESTRIAPSAKDPFTQFLDQTGMLAKDALALNGVATPEGFNNQAKTKKSFLSHPYGDVAKRTMERLDEEGIDYDPDTVRGTAREVYEAAPDASQVNAADATEATVTRVRTDVKNAAELGLSHAEYKAWSKEQKAAEARFKDLIAPMEDPLGPADGLNMPAQQPDITETPFGIVSGSVHTPGLSVEQAAQQNLTKSLLSFGNTVEDVAAATGYDIGYVEAVDANLTDEDRAYFGPEAADTLFSGEDAPLSDLGPTTFGSMLSADAANALVADTLYEQDPIKRQAKNQITTANFQARFPGPQQYDSIGRPIHTPNVSGAWTLVGWAPDLGIAAKRAQEQNTTIPNVLALETYGTNQVAEKLRNKMRAQLGDYGAYGGNIATAALNDSVLRADMEAFSKANPQYSSWSGIAGMNAEGHKAYEAADPPPLKWSTVIVRKTEDLRCRTNAISLRKLSRNYGRLKSLWGKACPALTPFGTFA